MKRRSHCYHLSESLPLECALNDTRFLQMDVDLKRSPVHKKRSKGNRKKVKARVLKRKHGIGRPKRGPEEVNWTKKGDKNDISEALSITFSEAASVSGIIKKYFSDHDEVASSRRRLNSRTKSKNLKIQSPQEASREKHIKPQVGSRLLLASESLGLSPSNQRPVLSLCKYSDEKSLFHTVRNLVFEMTEESE